MQGHIGNIGGQFCNVSRRNNRHAVGVREGAEKGKTPSEFMAGLLKHQLSLAVTPTLY